MEDRFRFRAWDLERGIMHYNVEREPVDHTSFEWLVEDDEYIVMQCTGLKDKNGKLIYEGDILEQTGLPHKVVCEWVKDGFWLNGFANGAKRELRTMHNWYEVIGNIYENKELLK